MVPLHMRPNVSAYSKPGIKSTNRMFDEAVAPEDLIWFAAADRPVFSGSSEHVFLDREGKFVRMKRVMPEFCEAVNQRTGKETLPSRAAGKPAPRRERFILIFI